MLTGSIPSPMVDGQDSTAAASLPIPASGPSFSSLPPGLSPWIVDHLASLSFLTSTPVQASTIPLLLKHKDVIVEAVTGSGKTFAYLIPLLELIKKQPPSIEAKTAEEEDVAAADRDDGIKALVLLPTRELAIQVHTVLLSLIQSAPLSVSRYFRPQLVVGGGRTQHHAAPERGEDEEDDGVGGHNTPQQDFARLRKERNNIIIGTPGRVEGLFSRGIIRGKAKAMEVLVLDEADRLLDLGFLPSLTSILAALPKQRRTALFSATMTDALGELVRLGLRNPVRITVKVEMKKKASANAVSLPSSDSSARIPPSLQNFFLISPRHHKVSQLVRLLRDEPQRHYTQKIVVFFATCAQVEYFYKVLSALTDLKHCRLYSLHGRQNPTRRTKAFNAFLQDVPGASSSSHPDTTSASVLFCTDVASRGLDLPNLDLVIQFDPPQDPNLFNHRIGRTARAGKSGRAVCLLSEGSEESYVDFLRLRGVRGQRYVFPPRKGDEESEGLEEALSRHASSLRAQNLADLATHDLFKLALVSFVRAYGKHEASFIFPKKQLDSEIKEMARSWGGVRLPKMGELKSISRTKGEDNGADDLGEAEGWLEGRIDEATWAYKDPAKEKIRLSKLQTRPASHPHPQSSSHQIDGEAEEQEGSEGETADQHPSSSSISSKSQRKRMRGAQESTLGAWSKQKAAKEKRDQRKEKRSRKRLAIERVRQAEMDLPEGGSEGGKGKGKVGKVDVLAAADDHEDDHEEDEDDSGSEWAEEERQIKKSRRRLRREADRLAGERALRGEAGVLDGDGGFELGGGGRTLGNQEEGGGFFDDL